MGMLPSILHKKTHLNKLWVTKLAFLKIIILTTNQIRKETDKLPLEPLIIRMVNVGNPPSTLCFYYCAHLPHVQLLNFVIQSLKRKT